LHRVPRTKIRDRYIPGAVWMNLEITEYEINTSHERRRFSERAHLAQGTLNVFATSQQNCSSLKEQL
jgi:hypothetical protein